LSISGKQMESLPDKGGLGKAITTTTPVISITEFIGQR
jgi:hypothetical protein